MGDPHSSEWEADPVDGELEGGSGSRPGVKCTPNPPSPWILQPPGLKSASAHPVFGLALPFNIDPIAERVGRQDKHTSKRQKEGKEKNLLSTFEVKC